MKQPGGALACEPVSDERVPLVVGAAGLTGRPQTTRPYPPQDEPVGFDGAGEPVWASPRAPGRAIPPACLRALQMPPERSTCAIDCPGQQRGGGCLCDVVRAANTQGVDWKFEVDRDGFWVYAGPPLAGP